MRKRFAAIDVLWRGLRRELRLGEREGTGGETRPTGAVTRREVMRWAWFSAAGTLLSQLFRPGPARAEGAITRFAIIGDYGEDGAPEADVAALVKSWTPEFIVTNGDNNYGDDTHPEGSAATIDKNIGKHYHEFIYPYRGSYGPGSDTNRFFPALADKEWNPAAGYQPYLDYFTLPNNERYYDVVWGCVHVFVLNSDSHEPHGYAHPSTQSAWLQQRLAASTAVWKLVVAHHPPFSSNTSYTRMQWPFKQWGASAVSSGQAHVYERILRDGFLYMINGLGGRSTGGFQTPVAGSVVRYGDDYGAQLVTASEESITFSFYTRRGDLIDTCTLLAVAAPANLRATVLSSTQIDLSWTDTSSAEHGFRIERSGDGASFTRIATVGPNVTAYRDSTVTSGRTYYYRVASYRGVDQSGYSNTASAAVVGSPPAAPTNLTARGVSSSQIDLSWTDNSNNEEGFEIERSTDRVNFTWVATVGGSRTSYSDTGRSPGVTCYYRVRARNQSGASGYSNTAAGTPIPTLTAPTSLAATVNSSSKITLNWRDNSSGETGFKVEMSTDGVHFTVIKTLGANATRYAKSGLSPDTTYHFRVRAYTASGFSGYSNTVSATTRKAKPAAPSGMTATAVSSTQIRLAWVDNATNEEGQRLYRSADGINFGRIAFLGPNVTSYLDAGRLPGRTYYYRVSAYNSGGSSTVSNTASATTPRG